MALVATVGRKSSVSWSNIQVDRSSTRGAVCVSVRLGDRVGADQPQISGCAPEVVVVVVPP